MTTTPDFDLEITKNETRDSAPGNWNTGTIDGRYRFCALVFADHAESEEYELHRSRISKLWIRDTQAGKTVFNFDRGPDVPATDTATEAVVGFLCAGLADLIHG